MGMLVATLLMLAAPQAATVGKPEQAADGGQRWSILADSCQRRGDDQIVVCGEGGAASQRLPLPGERAPPDHPMPSNPNVDGAGALAAAAPPCATLSQGCTTGVDLFGAGTFLVRAAGKAIDAGSCCEEPGEATSPVLLARDVVSVVKRAFRKKPDRSNRVPIPLDDPAPAP